eukprot:Nk52_evm38s295 gene=Nk52_evmTU38s295
MIEKRDIFAVICLAGVVVIWISQSEVSQRIQSDPKLHFDKPYLLVYLNHSALALLLPCTCLYLMWTNKKYVGIPTSIGEIKRTLSGEGSGGFLGGATEEIEDEALIPQRNRMRRDSLSGVRSNEVKQSGKMHTGNPFAYLRLMGLRPYRLIRIGSGLSVLYFVANYLYFVPLSLTTVNESTVIFNLSCVFVYIFSVLFLNAEVVLMKVVAIGFSLIGAIVITLHRSKAEPSSSSSSSSSSSGMHLLGDMLILGGAVLYGLFEVLYNRYIVKERMLPFPAVSFIMGWIGLATMLLVWPGLFFVHFVGLEKFEIPSWEASQYVLLNIALAFSFNALFMICLALLSPLLVSMTTLLTIPLSGVADYILHGTMFGIVDAFGGLLVVIGLAMLALKEHWEHVEERNKQRVNNPVETQVDIE